MKYYVQVGGGGGWLAKLILKANLKRNKKKNELAMTSSCAFKAIAIRDVMAKTLEKFMERRTIVITVFATVTRDVSEERKIKRKTW